MSKVISHIRKDYKFSDKSNLYEKDVAADPLMQFSRWFNDALEIDPMEANAMFLATSTSDGKPSVRTVLLKGFDGDGFTFFTNYNSRKGKELINNPNASVLFFWKELGRQIRIEGRVKKVSRKDSDLYFHSRPVDSQLAALSSDQSKVIPDREFLENKFNRFKEMYSEGNVPLPDNWGGFKLTPVSIEFWQGRQNRMHDRILYRKIKNVWKIQRLSP